jgi:hypothetical protein
MSERQLPKEIANFISGVIAHFAGEARRLHDTSVLLESRDILRAYFNCLRELGTIEHEVALDTIGKQMQIVKRDASKSRALLWRRFRKVIREKVAQTDPVIADSIRTARKMGEQTLDDHELYINLQQVIEAAESAVASHRRLETTRVEIERELFRFYVGTHLGVYTRLTLRRILSFLGKHTLIVLGSIVGLGICYSWLVRESQSMIARAYHLGNHPKAAIDYHLKTGHRETA